MRANVDDSRARRKQCREVGKQLVMLALSEELFRARYVRSKPLEVDAVDVSLRKTHRDKL